MKKLENIESEKRFYEEKQRMKTSSNPWERVISNVEINTA
jgi:hypothetical protein